MVLIGDIIDIPLIDVTAKAFQVEISDWSTKVIIPTASKRKASLTLLTLSCRVCCPISDACEHSHRPAVAILQHQKFALGAAG